MGRLVASRFVIELTLLELGEDGEPLNEYVQAPHTVYGLAGARRWLDELPAHIEAAARQLRTEGGDAPNGHNTELRASLPERNR